MATRNKSNRTSKDLKRSEVNLVSARSALSDDTGSYSRKVRGGGYAKQRSKRATKRRVLIGIAVTLIALLVGGTTAAFGFVTYLNGMLGTDAAGGTLDTSAIAAVTVDRQAPQDPFWMLLVGTDWDPEGGDSIRSDVIMLVHIDPGTKKAALVSVPRDTMVTLGDYGTQKINAAYAYGNMEADEGLQNSGPAYLIQAVTALTGAQIAGYAEVNFDGLVGIVDTLGGVEVDVPLDIIGDREAGPVDVYAGDQVLDGEHALVFARSRQYAIGDFQRQANQRVLLQAIANKVLSEDPVTIISTVTQLAQMTTTNMNIGDIANLAVTLRGMQMTDIYTYSLPSTTTELDGIDYVLVDQDQTQQLINDINAGNYPDYSDQTYQGDVADIYKATTQATDNSTATAASTGTTDTQSSVDPTQYSVSVRNGYGIAGSAQAVSDMLALAGYQQSEIGNANSFVYTETLIIYRDDSDRAAAEDIQARLGYGRVIPSLDRYSFDGNILVMVGGDFVG